MILLDTSAWIYYLNKSSLSFEQLQKIVVCGPVVQEILQGIRDPLSHNKIKKALCAMPWLDNPIPQARFLEASDLYRTIRKNGFTIRSSTDCLIAVIAMANGVPVMHFDRDFATIARFSSLTLEIL